MKHYSTRSMTEMLADCGLKDIRFVTQEGGSVGVHFKITAHPKDEIDHGKIATRLQQEITITLTPPDNYVEPGLFGEATSDEEEERDTFEGSEFAQDESRIEPTPAKRGRRAVTH